MLKPEANFALLSRDGFYMKMLHAVLNTSKSVRMTNKGQREGEDCCKDDETCQTWTETSGASIQQIGILRTNTRASELWTFHPDTRDEWKVPTNRQDVWGTYIHGSDDGGLL